MKKISILVLSICMFFAISMNAKAAIYNGVAGDGGVGSGGSCPDNYDCIYNNKNHRYTILQLKFIYADANHHQTQYGKTVIMGTPSSQEYVRELAAQINNTPNHRFTYDGGIQGSGDTKYNINYVKNYFLPNGNSTDEEYVTNKVKSFFGVSDSQLQRRSDEGIGFNKAGYRIIIEPVISYLPANVTGTSKLNFGTVKEVMRIADNGNANDTIDITGMYLTVQYPDIGINAVNKKPSAVHESTVDMKSLISRANSGYGMNIINVGNKINAKKCYKLATTSTPLICKNTNSSNYATFNEKYNEVSCTGLTEEEKKNTQYGRKVYESGSCKIYCTEEVTAALPGNVGTAISVGNSIIWPSLASDKYGVYKFNVVGKRTCKMENCGNFTPTINQVYSNFNASAKVRTSDLEYGGQVTLQTDTSISSVTKNGDTLTAIRSVNLKLPPTKNRYINPLTGKYSDTKKTNYVNLNHGRLATSLNAPVGKKLYIYVSNIKLGANNVFGQEAAKNNYVCNYEQTRVSDDTDGKCKCPPNSENKENAGAILDYFVLTEHKSCSQVQEEKCGGKTLPDPVPERDSPYCTDTYGNKRDIAKCMDKGFSEKVCEDAICPVGIIGPLPEYKFCPAPNNTVPIDSCLALGMSEAVCVEILCEIPVKQNYCPAPKDNISIQSCLNKGTSRKTCIEKHCPPPIPPGPTPIPPGPTPDPTDPDCDPRIEVCDDDDPTPPDCDPTVEICSTPKYCPPPNQDRSIAACLNAGSTYESCVNRLCRGTKKNYQCPANTPNEFMDISNCVESFIAKNESEANAIRLCERIVCPDDGIAIIYRPISLINPFPSKDINGGIRGFNTDNISGRYPGSNWNSQTLVNNKILNNRGVANNAVYDEPPLYVIDLDADIMRSIRSYNDRQERLGGYSDFTLECNHGARCLSRQFLRGTLGSHLSGGTCRSASSTNFYTCDN